MELTERSGIALFTAALALLPVLMVVTRMIAG